MSSLTTYQKQDREHTEAIKTLYSERDANSRLTNELEELQDAVMALNPFINSVDFLVSENGFGEFECDACDAKALHIYKIEHTSDCPVAKLREVLKKQGVSDE